MSGRLRSRARLVSCEFDAYPAAPFKMLHGVCHVNMAAIDSRFLQSAVHNFRRWSDKRPAGDVFIIPRLFPNQHNWRILGSLAKDSLRRVLVKVTCLAMLCRLAYR